MKGRVVSSLGVAGDVAGGIVLSGFATGDFPTFSFLSLALSDRNRVAG